MKIDISASQVKTVVSSGEKIYYSFDVTDLHADNPILESFNSTDANKAKTFYENTKAKYPNATTNGKISDPFKDGTFVSQTDYEVGGFKGAKETGYMSTDVMDESGADRKYNEDDINAYGPVRRGPVSSDPNTPNVSKTHKKARDRSGMKVENGVTRWTSIPKEFQEDDGVFGRVRMQTMVQRPKLDCEEIVGQGVDNNAFIVIGNDRVEKFNTGYGGKGHTQCDAIDLVAGMGGPSPREADEDNIPVDTNPNFLVDAARIYISQKTDVDKNFAIGEFGKSEKNSLESTDENEKNIGKYGAKSAIAIKADNVRMIGRESIRLVTGTDAKNSQGGDVLAKSGIEIVAMNDTTTLQPMVLGDNLQLALITVTDNMAAIAEIMHGYIKYQMKFNQALQQHTHITPFFGLPALPSETAIIGGITCDIETATRTELSVLKHLTNLQGVKHNFLTESGESFINSRLNKVN